MTKLHSSSLLLCFVVPLIFISVYNVSATVTPSASTTVGVPESSSPILTIVGSSTVQPAGECNITLQDGCCEDEKCSYFNCTNHEACHLQNFTKEGCNNVCITPTTISTPVPTTSENTTIIPNTTTPNPVTSSSTEPNTTSSTIITTPKQNSPSQQFDAASFIGGIVLCAGLVAITYFGCKFYKARTDRNYHTL